jgi:CheY-like chemotaxis protein
MPSVLVVEDDAEIRTSVELLLVRAGYEVRCARSANEALDLLTARAPCIVLWDPVTLHVSAAFLEEAATRGVHVATIPVGVRPADGKPGCRPALIKALTSRSAILSVVRAYCPDLQAMTT